MKYKIGDKLRVRKDLIAGQWYGEFDALEEMEELSGKIVTIEDIRENGGILIKEDRWSWSEEMFEGKIDENEIKNIDLKEELKQNISVLKDIELSRATDLFGKFNSKHEGYAVICEEIEELEEQLDFINEYKEAFWKAIKENKCHTNYVKRILIFSQNVAYEAIQVAAMAKRYLKDVLQEEESK